VRAVEALAEDLADSVISVEQPASLDGMTGLVEDYTVAVLNRGLPGFNVEPDGSLYLSLLRSCSGWPSGVWIDPPRRSVPDGSNFQFQHWSHVFEYALVAGAGDWRTAEIVRVGHEYNNPLTARSFESHAGGLPAMASYVQVEPASVVATVVKPAGNPLARMAAPELDPAGGIVFRLYESSGRPTDAVISSTWPLGDAVVTSLTEEKIRALRAKAGRITVPLEPFEIVTVRATPSAAATPARSKAAKGGKVAKGAKGGKDVARAPRGEAAQPVFSGYWLHNKGAAPMGYQPVTVQIRPWFLRGVGPFKLPVVVASERTDAPVAGSVSMVVPRGWKASPAERVYRLAPGAHLELVSTVTPAARARAGRYFVAARITDDAGQEHEDVVTIDLAPGRKGGGTPATQVGSPTLARSIERSLRTAGIAPAIDASDSWFSEGLDDDPDLAGELVVEPLTADVSLTAGQAGKLRVLVRNRAASEIRGEAQVISPYDTWPFITPWTQGFAVGPGKETILTFAVDPPYDFPGGTYWALVKVMYFGRLQYTDSIPIEVLPAPSGLTAPAAGRKRRI
jgi:hypothetical protein